MTRQFQSDVYTDLVGRKWWCTADQKRKQMVCNSDDGYFTCAGFDTFTVWGWKPDTSLVPPADRARE